MKLNERCVAEYSTSSAPTDKEGYLNKKGELNRGYQRRWFILKGNLLYYFEKRSDKEPIGVIILDNCHVELAESGEPYAFQITFAGDGSRTYILGADTPKEMESWMRAITHSNYECLRMMVESFESKLEQLKTSEENDLGSTRSSSSTSSTTTASAANFSDFSAAYDKPNGASAYRRPVSEINREFSVKDSKKMVRSASEAPIPASRKVVGGIAQKEKKASIDRSSSSIDRSSRSQTIDRTEPSLGHLIDFEDDDDQLPPIQNEFSFNDGFYSIPKHSEDLMPLSYSDLERLEDIHTEDFFSRLSGNHPPQSKDDTDMILRPPRPGLLTRNQRPKSERRRNNVTVYSLVDTTGLEKGKSRTLARSLNLSDDIGYQENRNIFRYLHQLYSASIWVKCKEFGKQDLITT